MAENKIEADTEWFGDGKKCKKQCTDTFNELLCVEFEATFVVDIKDCQITNVECLGPCPE